MNRLKNTRCYLIGCMDRVPDAGAAWRKQIKNHLENLDIMWFDPTCKPIDLGAEDDESRLIRRANKAAGWYDLVEEEMIPIRNVDLRMVSICDFLICNIDVETHACGTYNELFLANSQEKPILVHIEQGRKECPDWLLACLPHEHIFGSWGGLIDYVKHIAHDKTIDCMGRWMFFDFHGEE